MCRYRKIVTQEEQYNFNLRKIEEWRNRNSIQPVKRDISVDLRPNSRQLAMLDAEKFRDTLIDSEKRDSRQLAMREAN